ncbi:hypothetical protein SLA2020_456290 [Shorea laevis]
MNLDSKEENTNEGKVEQGMNKNGCTTGLKVAKLHVPLAPWHLEQQPRRQQYEQHHRNENWTPIRHFPHLLCVSDVVCEIQGKERLTHAGYRGSLAYLYKRRYLGFLFSCM